MSIGISTRLSLSFKAARDKTIAALKEEGFGVITEIDVRETLKEKINIDFRPYTILGACNPRLAHRALEADPEAGLLLPCNVIVYEEEGESVVSTIDPVDLLSSTGNDSLRPVAQEARSRLERVIRCLSEQ